MAKAKLGSGKRFRAVSNDVAAEYERKGMSPEKAKEVGAAVAAEAGRKAHGAKAMARYSAMGRARAKKS